MAYEECKGACKLQGTSQKLFHPGPKLIPEIRKIFENFLDHHIASLLGGGSLSTGGGWLRRPLLATADTRRTAATSGPCLRSAWRLASPSPLGWCGRLSPCRPPPPCARICWASDRALCAASQTFKNVFALFAFGMRSAPVASISHHAVVSTLIGTQRVCHQRASALPGVVGLGSDWVGVRGKFGVGIYDTVDFTAHNCPPPHRRQPARPKTTSNNVLCVPISPRPMSSIDLSEQNCQIRATLGLNLRFQFGSPKAHKRIQQRRIVPGPTGGIVLRH